VSGRMKFVEMAKGGGGAKKRKAPFLYVVTYNLLIILSFRFNLETD
jgi:hypothetical protein